MKFYFMLFLSSILVLGCSQNITRSLYKSIIITSDKEIISDLEGLETNLLKHLNNPSIQNFSIEDIFEGTWLSSIKTSHLFDKSISVEVKEHHPIASIDKDRYITQSGISIFPKGKYKELRLINIRGPEDSILNLIDQSRNLQAKLNRVDLRVISFELKNKDQLTAKDNSGTEYIFSKKEFRVQLERLEDYISFELNSGKTDHIRYIDFRYNNAIAVFYS